MKAASYMLDTDTFSYLVSGRRPAVRKQVARHQKAIVLSAITLAESLFGARKNGSQKLLSVISLFREIFPVQPWNSDAAEVYSKIRAEMEGRGQPIGNMDMLIAASAIASGCTLVTNNERHFRRVPGLTLANWTQEP